MRRQSRSSKDAGYGMQDDGGMSLTVSTAAGGPLESAVTSRDGLSMSEGLVDVSEAREREN